MSTHPVTLTLPESLMRRAQHTAQTLGWPLEEVLIDVLSATLPDLKDAPAERHAELNFPQITYRQGASGRPQPVLLSSGIRVQTVAVASLAWGWSTEQIADEYGLSPEQVREALDFYVVHRQEMDMDIEDESALGGAVG